MQDRQEDNSGRKEQGSYQVALKIGYWDPYAIPKELKVRDTRFVSLGIYNTPELYDADTDRYHQNCFHLTPDGHVYEIVNSSRESIFSNSNRTFEQKFALVGSNGEVTRAPTPEVGKPTTYLKPPDTFSFTPISSKPPTS